MFNALLHASRFQCRCVVLMHIWPGYIYYQNFLKGGHILSFCQNVTKVDVNFKAHQPILAFTGPHNFRSYIFNIDFDGLQDLKTKLSSCEDKFELDNCLMEGCYLCYNPGDI